MEPTWDDADDLVLYAGALGMPDESIDFNTLPDEPYDGTTIDDPESLELLEEFLSQRPYGLVFIDTLTYATSRDLCVAKDIKDLMTPVRDLAQKYHTAIVPLLHVSRDGQALGKRIKGLARTILKLECPDPDKSSRLKLLIDKSFAKKPPALGVTLTDKGNEYDSNPPEPPPPGVVGRPPKSRDEASKFILDTLEAHGDQQATRLCERWEAGGKSGKAFWGARTALVDEGRITCSGRPLILALVVAEAGAEPDFESF